MIDTNTLNKKRISTQLFLPLCNVFCYKQIWEQVYTSNILFCCTFHFVVTLNCLIQHNKHYCHLYNFSYSIKNLAIICLIILSTGRLFLISQTDNIFPNVNSIIFCEVVQIWKFLIIQCILRGSLLNNFSHLRWKSLTNSFYYAMHSIYDLSWLNFIMPT